MRLRSMAPAAAMLLALTACGAGQNTPSVASAGTPEAVFPASASPSTSSDPLKFAQCLREHGIDVKDPKPGGGISARVKGDKAKMDKAHKACAKYMQGGMLGGKGPDDPAVRDEMLKLAQCLRENGVNVADPEPGGGIAIRRDAGVDEKTIEKAHKACEHLVRDRGHAPAETGTNG